MKNIIRILMVLIVAVLTANAAPAYADHGGWHGGGHWGGGHVHVHAGPGWRGYGWWGPGWGVGWGPGWWGWGAGWGPGWWGVPVSQPVVVQQPTTDIYVQPTPQPETRSYWFFCKDPQGYYPYVKRCPQGWMRVVPPSNSVPEGEE